MSCGTAELLDDSFTLETLQKVNQRNNLEDKYNDMLLDRLIEDITFLKDEICLLREDIKRKSDETTFLFKLSNSSKTLQITFSIKTMTLNSTKQCLKHSNELNVIKAK